MISKSKSNSKKSKEPLKDQNAKSLSAIVIANIVVFVIVLKTGQLLVEDFSSLLKEWVALVPASIGALLVGVLNGFLSAETKARLVFWRWSNPLPGSEAFSRYMYADARIDVGTLKKKMGTLPTNPHEQNSFWYKLYKSNETDASVVHQHRLFLLTRDYAGIAFMLLFVLGSISWFCMPSRRVAAYYVVALVLQYLLAALAANNYGKRFVCTVLALSTIG